MNRIQIDENGRPLISEAAMMRAECPFTDPELRQIIEALTVVFVADGKTMEEDNMKRKVHMKALSKARMILEAGKTND